MQTSLEEPCASRRVTCRLDGWESSMGAAAIIRRLEDQARTLKEQVGELEGELRSFRSDYRYAEGKIKELERDLKLSRDVNVNRKDEVEELENRVNELEDEACETAEAIQNASAYLVVTGLEDVGKIDGGTAVIRWEDEHKLPITLKAIQDGDGRYRIGPLVRAEEVLW